MRKLVRFTPIILFFIFLVFSKTPYKSQAQVFTILPNNLASGDIITVVGGDRAFGDGEIASQASLNAPNAAIFDKSGNLLIADTNNHRIRKIDLTSGKITTIAGNGKPGFTGDAELATTTSLNFPTGIAIDERGTLFIADSGNNRIRRVDPDSSVITTIAGNGNTGQDRDNVNALDTSLTNPFSLVIDKAGNLYTLQLESFRVRRIEANSRTISTIAGSGRPGVSRDGEKASMANLIPVAIAIDNQDNLLIVDTNGMPQVDNILISNRIRKVDSQTNVITSIAGNACNPFRTLTCSYTDKEVATNVSLIAPMSVAVDEMGNLFIADDNKIKRVDKETGIIETIAGNGIKVLAANNGNGGLALKATIFPTNLLAQNGTLFIVDNGYDQIRRVDTNTQIIELVAGLGIGDGGQAKAAKLVAPGGITFDSNNNLFIADTLHHLVRLVDSTTGKITSLVGTGKNGFNGDGKIGLETDLSEPINLTTDGDGNLFIVERNRIRFFNLTTKIVSSVAGTGVAGFSGDGAIAVNARLNNPTSIIVDPVGNVFIADTGNNRIRRIDKLNGNISTFAGNGQKGFSGDGGQATNASLAAPISLAFDRNNNLLLLDESNRVRSINLASGIITTIIGSGKVGFKGDGKTAKKASLNFPKAILVDKDNSIFLADTLNNRIRKVESGSGIITTIAGDGKDALLGDNMPATKASLSTPSHIAIDNQGNLFVSDKKNNVVRAIKGKG
jgi:sugar lactone lactonase YvrE